MQQSKFFKEIPSWPSYKIREYIDDKNSGQYNLIDVRQPAEYEEEHIPGAILIPVGEIQFKIGEIDRTKTTFIYCRSGNRSRSAAGVLISAGFDNVYNMDGGIQAWDGFIASRAPVAGVAYFLPGEKSETLISLAWSLEEGSKKFYKGVSADRNDSRSTELFNELANAERQHSSMLSKLYSEIASDGNKSDDINSLQTENTYGLLMEGGVQVDEALSWASGKSLADILDFSIALEVNAYDLYIKMERELPDARLKKVFLLLADQEKDHLKWMTDLIEQNLKKN